MISLTPFAGGRRLITFAGAAGVLGLAVTGVGLALDPQRALYGYLVAFAYWLGIALGALILLAVVTDVQLQRRGRAA